MAFTLALFRRRPCKIFTASFAAVLVVGQLVAAGPILDWTLRDAAVQPTSQWADHIFNSFEKSLATNDGFIPVAGALDGAMGTGTVHHFDLLRGDSELTVSPTKNIEDIADGVAELFSGTTSGTSTIGHHVSHNAQHLDRRVGPVPQGQPSFVLTDAPQEGTAGRYAEATFTRLIGGEPITLRIITDMTTTAASMKLLLGLAAIIFTLVSTAVIGIAARVTYKSRQAEEMSDLQARYLAERDSLTGLFNRYGFGVRAEAALEICSREGRKAFLVQFDANKFKDINDLHGHPVGDEVLFGIAAMIRKEFPESAIAARFGGDEFAVLVEERSLDGNAVTFLANMSTSTTLSICDGKQKITVDTSAGFAVFPHDGSTLVELMKAADLALYSVKQSAKSRVGGYRRDMTQALQQRLWEIDGIRDAVGANQIQPYYQPLVNAQTQGIEGLEALVRWNHPARGMLSPDDFSHALDDPAASLDITRAMLSLITDDLAAWRRAGHLTSVGLNVGETDLKQPRFIEMLDEALEATNLCPEALAIEVTESAVNAFNIDEFIPVLKKVRDRGMYIALDDFGTGSSSISLLKRLPCTAVKIDKSFVRGMLDCHDDLSIVRAMIRLAHDLNIKVVAEGVESEAQCHKLRDMGCDLLQGYYFSAPVPAERVEQILANGGLAPRWTDWQHGRLMA